MPLLRRLSSSCLADSRSSARSLSSNTCAGPIMTGRNNSSRWPKPHRGCQLYFSRPGPRLVDGVELLGDIVSGAVSAGCNSPMVRDVSGSLALIGSSR